MDSEEGDIAMIFFCFSRALNDRATYAPGGRGGGGGHGACGFIDVIGKGGGGGGRFAVDMRFFASKQWLEVPAIVRCWTVCHQDDE
jgi:hypothetical protein